MMVLGGVLGLVVGVALILAVGALLDHRMGLEEACHDRARREREQAILRLEVELGFRDPEEVRWRPAPHGYVLDAARASEKDREIIRAILRHKRAHHG